MTTIQIERLKAPCIVHAVGGDFGPFGAFAEVQDIQFDGEGYQITVLLIEGADDHVGDTELEFTVDAGGSVEFGGRGEPVLRALGDVDGDEWQAKFDACMAKDAADRAAMLADFNATMSVLFQPAYQQAAE